MTAIYITIIGIGCIGYAFILNLFIQFYRKSPSKVRVKARASGLRTKRSSVGKCIAFPEESKTTKQKNLFIKK